jgi:hypothetical protein
MPVLQNVLDIRFGWASAVIANAIKAQNMTQAGIRRSDSRRNSVMQLIGTCDIRRDKAHTEHLAASRTSPAEGMRGQLYLARRGTVEDIAGIVQLCQQIGQGSRMPERIDIVSNRGPNAEMFSKVALSVEKLTAPAHLGW